MGAAADTFNTYSFLLNPNIHNFDCMYMIMEITRATVTMLKTNQRTIGEKKKVSHAYT